MSGSEQKPSSVNRLQQLSEEKRALLERMLQQKNRQIGGGPQAEDSSQTAASSSNVPNQDTDAASQGVTAGERADSIHDTAGMPPQTPPFAWPQNPAEAQKSWQDWQKLWNPLLQPAANQAPANPNPATLPGNGIFPICSPFFPVSPFSEAAKASRAKAAAGQTPFTQDKTPGNASSTAPKAQPIPQPFQPEPLVALKKSGSQLPLFLVAPVFGSAFPYHYLALHVEAEQPIYGLQSPALDGKTPPHTSIPEMARDYIKRIRRIQPLGPYQLGGYSFGGWVAFEIAHQLIANGESIRFLGMLGTPPPPGFATPQLTQYILYQLELKESQAKLAKDTSLSDQERLKNTQPLQQIADANNAAALRYLPRPIEVKLELFATADVLSGSPTDPTLGWWLLTTREIHVQIHDGNHLNCFSEPCVRDLAKKLTERLRRARANNESTLRSGT